MSLNVPNPGDLIAAAPDTILVSELGVGAGLAPPYAPGGLSVPLVIIDVAGTLNRTNEAAEAHLVFAPEQIAALAQGLFEAMQHLALVDPTAAWPPAHPEEGPARD